AELSDGRWFGRADLLVKVPASSTLGEWSYEVVDTKLAEETRAETVLQLCQYSTLLAHAQGKAPVLMHVVKPGREPGAAAGEQPGPDPDHPFTQESFRFEDYAAYYRFVRRRLELAIEAPPAETTYPDPVAHCGICRWWKVCEDRRHADDALCLVAGIRPLHIAELQRQGIGTLRQYALEPKPLRQRPRRGSPETFARAHGQARVQLEGREAGRPTYTLLPPEEGKGFCLLPEPDPGDLFFDIESDPFAAAGGMEYLLGFAFTDDAGQMAYRAVWALNPLEEKRALEAFVDFAMQRWLANPGMHIYHFSPYEPGALKRLAGRYGSRESDLDKFLRGERFVDLLAVTRHGLQASVESYGLKDLEAFSGYARSIELPVAAAALRRVARALELAGASGISDEEREAVAAYNRDDCLSTSALRDWLEQRRAEHEMQGVVIPRPLSKSGEASDAIQERAADVQAVFDQLTAGLPEDRAAWGPNEKARWLLANQLEYFRREEKSVWWEFFRIRELDLEELLDERKAIAGLQFVEEVPGAGRLHVHRYSFPEQETSLDEGDKLYEVGGAGERVGRIVAFDPTARTVDIEKNVRYGTTHPDAVMADEHISPRPVDTALLEFARSVAADGVDGDGPFRAGRDLLLAHRPRILGTAGGRLRREGEGVVDAAVRLARGLASSILPIQGPPGSGKTYTGAQMIVALARAGKRIGVTAVSHKVIQHLLVEAIEASLRGGGAGGAGGGADGAPVGAIHKDSAAPVDIPLGLELTGDNDRARAGLKEGKIVGGTAWFWAREDMAESVDYLFIDEAGQMSLAHALAVSRAARNIVLLGDPQQLEQPQRGAHPEGAEVAALVHVLQGRKTIGLEDGLFLDETWRLHPAICEFTSELFYEHRLASRSGLERQRLDGVDPFSGSGLFYVPVEHTNNQNHSPEEVEAVARIVEMLRRPRASWTDSDGVSKTLSDPDILVVAPYNAQVAALSRRLGGRARVGTVDRFQGQQAPVVIYSMASSSAEDAPRGMSFLYNPNRLNVATSRARCVSILVAAPHLLEPGCGSPEQMVWANGLCRYREMATEVDLATGTVKGRAAGHSSGDRGPGAAPRAPQPRQPRKKPDAGKKQLELF
ncbi:MAG TPA: TM0106 family RecB-like putative nuclease, partial [Spirochaetia bacterium]|nr:TM0106 family RecB-like putative nuclease [Spirochaetia bacterium]